MLAKYPTKRIILFNKLCLPTKQLLNKICVSLFSSRIIRTSEFFLEERKQNYGTLRNTFGVREKTLTQLKEPRLGLEEKNSEYSKPELNL